MFGIIKAVVKFIVMLGMIAMLFFVYNTYKATSSLMSGEEVQNVEESQKAISYGRKAIATALNVASPVLKGLGVDVEGMFTEDSDEITRQIKKSNDMLSDAMNKLKSQ